MTEKLIDYLKSWLAETSPARKLADIGAVFLIAVLAGGLYTAYQAESDIRRLALKALDRTPEIDATTARRLSQTLLADCQKAEAEAVACFKVDLASNTTALVFYAGPDNLKKEFPRLQMGLERVPFIAASMTDEQTEIASAMMSGNPSIVYFKAQSVTLVCVPIPDRANSFLAGFVMAALPGERADADAAVVNLKLILSDFSNGVL